MSLSRSLTYVDSIAMGLLDGRLAIVGSGDGQIVAWDFHAECRSHLPKCYGRQESVPYPNSKDAS